MSLNIKNKDAHRLARELAEARGSSLRDAVIHALTEALRSARAPAAGLEALLAGVRQVQELVAWLPDRDTRSVDEILGYDELGLPV